MIAVKTAPCASLGAALRGLFPPQVAVALTQPGAPQPPLFAAETAAMARAVPTRRAEFAAGRAAARAAMAQLGAPAAALPMGPDRAPVWPAGITGSLSHIPALCIAAVAQTRQFRAIGTDLEEAGDLDPDLIPQVCTLAERAWLACQPAAQRGQLAKLIFSAKECAYKCQYPLTGTLFDFDTLEITPDPDTGQFEATFTRAIGCFDAGACLPGRFTIADGIIGCGMALAGRPRWAGGQGC
ncbi:4'-phosphopantetheinyl transferase family protein [Roseovarius dicentrarchi]|uniref:4'-phosphopantetheinyl transferase family protein n=1 Tax=Roseovarius dicentrarchi TaxID=2250573 RepID=UPI000DE97C61|nr:4'-phosphopantetheinyl transferase superfamily protein [Roseovarius dicentrarchi]